jgi:hypothetical protein
MSTPAYAYAGNNPLRFVDPNGREVVVDADHDIGRIFNAIDAARSCSCVHQWFQDCFGADPFQDATRHQLIAWADSLTTNPLCLITYGNTWLGSESYLCPKAFDFTGGNWLYSELLSTILHELAHQMAPLKTNDWLSASRGGRCSAQEAESIGFRLENAGCSAACEVAGGSCGK